MSFYLIWVAKLIIIQIILNFMLKTIQMWQKCISINAEIRFGKPCIKGTRISVDDILGWLANDMSYEKSLKIFPP
jgi:uncharacterized protein (DUF433 family)